jgi:Transglycosylase SLT domain
VAVGAAGIAVGVGTMTLGHPSLPQAVARPTTSYAPGSSVLNEANALIKARQDAGVVRVSRQAVRPPLLSQQRADKAASLPPLWVRESGWNPYAQNSSSGAYGIPQALPGSKMASAGSDWATNPETQIRWGLSYIRASYGSPCGAWSHSESYGWY